MSDKITLDSNILIYAFANNDDIRKSIAKNIIAKCNIISLQYKVDQRVVTVIIM